MGCPRRPLELHLVDGDVYGVVLQQTAAMEKLAADPPEPLRELEGIEWNGERSSDIFLVLLEDDSLVREDGPVRSSLALDPLAP